MSNWKFKPPAVLTAIAMFLPSFAYASTTNGNDTIIFIGTNTALSQETFSAPSGGTVVRPADTYNVNNSSVDGLDGTDIMVQTNGNDLIDERTSDVLDNVEIIIAGDGNDVILMDQTEATTVAGGLGNDILIDIGTRQTNDIFSGSEGDDFIDGGAGDDTVLGELDNDTLYGGTGNDLVDGGEGTNTLFLGSGDDIARFILTANMASRMDSIHLGSGDDFIEFSNLAFADAIFTVTSQSYSGLVLNTLFSVSNPITPNAVQISLFEDTGLSDGLLDGFLFPTNQSGAFALEKIGRDTILGSVPPITVSQVPLPASGIMLLLSGLIGFGALRRRKAST